MNPRKTGTIISAIFATSGTVGATVIVAATFKSVASFGYAALGFVLVAVAWAGVVGWATDRPLLAALGAWTAAFLNLFLWTLVAVPLAVAIVTSGIAVRAAIRHGRDGSPLSCHDDHAITLSAGSQLRSAVTGHDA